MDIFSQAVYYTADSKGLLMASPQRVRFYLIYSALCIKRNNQTNYSVLPCEHNPYCQLSDALYFKKLPSYNYSSSMEPNHSAPTHTKSRTTLLSCAFARHCGGSLNGIL